MKSRRLRYGLLLLAVSVVIFAVAPFIGSPTIALREALATQSLNREIFWKLRLPRSTASFIVGAALALGGLVFQTIFRNALATPFTLGISGGASLGVALAFQVAGALALAPHPYALQIAAFAGAMLATALVHGISKLKRNFTTTDLLLAGVAVSFLFSSLIMFFQYVGNPDQTLRLMHWMMGGIMVSGMGDLPPLLLPLVVCAAFALARHRELDLLLLGDDLAQTRGLATRRFRRALFLAVSFMVGACVAICGPIGFVGLMVPHVCRLVFGARHLRLIPASLLLGGSLLALCDVLARSLVAPADMPIGVITALMGAPFFLWLLYTDKRSM
jgi:iron complex transport system permease protein